MVSLLKEYEKCHHIGSEINIGKHYEDCPAFQKMFFTDVNNLNKKDIFDPFDKDKLIILDAGEVLTQKLSHALAIY